MGPYACFQKSKAPNVPVPASLTALQAFILDEMLCAVPEPNRLRQRRVTLDLARILAELKSERDRIDRAISALAAVGAPGASPASIKRAVGRPKRGGLTPAGRKRLSEAMKKRWAERKKKRG